MIGIQMIPTQPRISTVCEVIVRGMWQSIIARQEDNMYCVNLRSSNTCLPRKQTNLKTPHFKREKEMNLKIFDSPTTRTKLCHRFHILQGQADQTTISDLFHRDFKVDLDG